MLIALFTFGCGGNGNGGTSAADQARITALEGKNTELEKKVEEATEKIEKTSMAPDLAASWEAIAGKPIEDALATAIGTGSTTVTTLQAAITQVATMYGLDAASAIALLNQTYPQFERLRATEVTTFLTALHAGGHLAATRDAVVYVLTGPKGDMGDTTPGTVLANAWEAIAGEAIADALEMQITRGQEKQALCRINT